MNAYVTADNNWGISLKGMPIVSIPAEKKTKLEEIAGSVVIYDLKGMENLPGQQPLKGCTNLIFTDGFETNVRGAKTFSDIEDLKKEALNYPTEQVNIISSEKLYKAFFENLDIVHVTKVDYSYNVDAYFENLDKRDDFVITADSDEMYCFDIVYSFLRYERRTR